MSCRQQSYGPPPRRFAGCERWAIFFAIGILLTAGMGYRLADDRYARPYESVPIPPETLARIPREFGDWIGRDVPLDKRIIEATDTDAHLSREYVKRGSGKLVRLWIAYGVRMRDLMPHRPEVCYPAAGWTLQDGQTVEAISQDTSVRRLGMFLFSRGGLDSRGIRVLHWYLVDGTHTADVGLLRSKAWRAPARSGYVLQVQVNADDSGLGAVPQEELLGFAGEAAPAIEQLMAAVLRPDSQGPDESSGQTPAEQESPR